MKKFRIKKEFSFEKINSRQQVNSYFEKLFSIKSEFVFLKNNFNVKIKK